MLGNFHAYKVHLCVFSSCQGRKGDPGISPGPAPKGEKVLYPHPTHTPLFIHATLVFNNLLFGRASYSMFMDAIYATRQFCIIAIKLCRSVLQGDSGILGPVGMTGQAGRKVRVGISSKTISGFHQIPSNDIKIDVPKCCI